MLERLITSTEFDQAGKLELSNANADMRFYINISEPQKSLSINLALGSGSTTNFFCKIDQSASIELNAHLKKNATAKFYGLTELSGHDAAIIAVHVHHEEGENLTEQKFYSYAADESRVKFTGRIVVSPGASGVVAHQLHRGVALSPKARIDAEPFLNIMHDDVRCTHGSTIGFVDEEARHYLMARGISAEEAERMLISSSQHEFLSAVGPEAMKKYFGVSVAQYE